MKRTQHTWMTILVLAVFTLMGVVSCQLGPIPGSGDEFVEAPGDQGYEGLEELNNPLTAVTCTFDGTTGILAVTFADWDVAVINRDKDSYIRVNGYTCGGGAQPLAKTNNTTQIQATGSGETEMLVIDYMGGVFATGRSTGVGIAVGASLEKLAIRGQTGTDRITLGDAGISVNTDTYLDISIGAGVTSIVISTGEGNDIINAQGNAYGTGTSAYSALPLKIYGGAGNDTITGGDEAVTGDTIYGGDGADTLTGGAGADTFYGGAGDDTFDAEADLLGNDTYNGGADTDTLTYANRDGAITATIGGTGGEATEADVIATDVETLNGCDEKDTLTCAATFACTLNGGAGDDTLTGADQDDTINGGDGADTIKGGAGADRLYGNAGDDTFDEETAANGGDTMYGSTGSDTVTYTGRTNALTVTMGDNQANDGENGELDNVRSDIEHIIGGGGDDTITGNNLDNQITGGAGDDTLSGGSGNDTFLEGTADSGSDVFNGNAGTDLVNYSGRTVALTVTMDGAAPDDGQTDTDPVTGGDQSEGDNVGADVENINGGTAADDITGNDLANEIFGGAGDDNPLNGGAGNDIIDGGAGTNTINCGDGDADIAFNFASQSFCEIY